MIRHAVSSFNWQFPKVAVSHLALQIKETYLAFNRFWIALLRLHCHCHNHNHHHQHYGLNVVHADLSHASYSLNSLIANVASSVNWAELVSPCLFPEAKTFHLPVAQWSKSFQRSVVIIVDFWYLFCDLHLHINEYIAIINEFGNHYQAIFCWSSN